MPWSQFVFMTKPILINVAVKAKCYEICRQVFSALGLWYNVVDFKSVGFTASLALIAVSFENFFLESRR